MNVMKRTFKKSQEEFENFRYLGLHIEQKQYCIYLHQQMYIDELKDVQTCKERRCPWKAHWIRVSLTVKQSSMTAKLNIKPDRFFFLLMQNFWKIYVELFTSIVFLRSACLQHYLTLEYVPFVLKHFEHNGQTPATLRKKFLSLQLND